MRSLRVRVAAIVALLAVVAVVAMTLLSQHVVQRDLERMRVVRAPFDARVLRAAAAALAQAPAESADAVLTRHAAGGAMALVLVKRGRIVAASQRELRGAEVRDDSLGQTVVSGSVHRGEERGLELVMRHPNRLALSPDTELLALPQLPALRDPSPAQMRQAVSHGLLVGALAALALAAVLVWMIAGRLTGPVEEIAAAARRMAGGDLGVRVAERGDDEVAALARDFNAMADAVQRERATRLQLTRDVAHELRTPLTALRAQIEALQDGVVTADAMRLAALHREVLLLARLVDDVQSIASSDAGELVLDLRAVPAREALHACADAFAPEAARRGIALHVDADDAAAHADAQRLAQILRNLVANALAATPAGGSVTLAARRAGAHVELSVRDTGCGIDAAHLPHIFDRFYRADPSRSRATGGSGLGLAIVQQLARAHGGEVSAASTLGDGTTITVRLRAA